MFKLFAVLLVPYRPFALVSYNEAQRNNIPVFLGSHRITPQLIPRVPPSHTHILQPL